MKKKLSDIVIWAIITIYAIVVQCLIIMMCDKIEVGWSAVRLVSETPKALGIALIHTSPLLILNLIYKKYKKRYNYISIIAIIVLVDLITPVYGGVGIAERIVSTANKIEIRKNMEIDKQYMETLLTIEEMTVQLNSKRANILYEDKHTLLEIKTTEEIGVEYKPVYKILTDKSKQAEKAEELVYIKFMVHPDDLEMSMEELEYTIMNIGESDKIYRLPIKMIDILNKYEGTVYLADSLELERDKYEIKVTNQELVGTELWSFYRDGQLVVQNNNPYGENKGTYNILRTSEKEVNDIFEIMDAVKDVNNPLNIKGIYSVCLIDYDEQLDRHIIISNILNYKR